MEKSTRVMDLACGAGSVLEHAHKLGFTNLTGVDVSQQALDVMLEKIPVARGICSQVDKLPQDQNSIDLIVSQFGVEYAGTRQKLHAAFQEMSRVLATKGRITIVAHAKNSVIYEGCSNSLEHAKLIDDSRFIETAKKTISSLHNNDREAAPATTQKLMESLNHSAEPIMAWLRNTDRSKNEFARFTYHLLESSHKLIANHAAYSKSESLNWFSGIEDEIEAYRGRMSSMTTAALSEVEISKLSEDLSTGQNGLSFLPVEKLYFPPNKKLAAWVIRAKKLT